MKHGKGTETWLDLEKHVGYYRNDKKHNHGVWRSSEGHVYEGAYKNGFRHGFGVMTYPSGLV